MSDITKTIETVRQAAEAVPEGERVWEHVGDGCVLGLLRPGAVEPQEGDYLAAACPANVLAVLNAIPRWRTGEPPTRNDYLVVVDYSDAGVRHVDIADWDAGQWSNDDWGVGARVTHWMPLPEQPND